MKKGLKGAIALLVFILGISMIGGKTVLAQEQDRLFTVSGKGTIEAERERLKRFRTFSELTPTQFYVKKGEQVQVQVSGGETNATGILLAIGTPDVANGIVKKELAAGLNTVVSDRDGVLSFINRQSSGEVTFEVQSTHETIPYFVLGTTTNEEFFQQMETLTTAPFVQLVSQSSVITVSPASAKKYLTDPKALMTYYDTFSEAQNKLEGTSNTGRGDYFSAQHRQHYVETASGYMYTNNEFMGFSGDGAMQRLLKTNNGWGIWHESGHQRQLVSMTWDGVVESTVNLYAMAAQKATTGRMDAVDRYYPQIQTYLNQANEAKNYDEIKENFVKFGLFAQLMAVFGDEFYPQLHQSYRLLEKQPQTDDEKKQVFIIQSSKVAQINLIPYFEKWGIPIMNDTKNQLASLPVLDQPIWQYTNTNPYHLELPQKQYFPELTYLKKAVKKVTSYNNQMFVTLASDWVQGYTYVITKNGTPICEIIDGQPSAAVAAQENGETVYTLDTQIASSDEIQVEVHHSQGVYSLATYSPYDSDLTDQFAALFTDESQTNLKESVTQTVLDDLYTKIPTSTNKDEFTKSYDYAQKMLLNRLVSDVSFRDNQLQVTWVDDRYKDYRVVFSHNNSYVSELNHGKVYYSTVQNNLWKTGVSNLADSDLLQLEFRLPNKTYYLQAYTGKELTLKAALEGMYDASGSIKSDVTQQQLTSLLQEINAANTLQQSNLLKKFDQVQIDYLKSLFASAQINAQSKMVAQFADDRYKEYKIVWVLNGKYAAEVDKGQQAYSSMSANRTWTYNQALASGDTGHIEVRLPNKTYRVFVLVKE